MVPTRALGKTGERISVLGFGTAAAGTRLNLRDAVRLYEEALNLGVTYFDTAPEFAGYGKAQEQLSYLLKERRKEVYQINVDLIDLPLKEEDVLSVVNLYHPRKSKIIFDSLNDKSMCSGKKVASIKAGNVAEALSCDVKIAHQVWGDKFWQAVTERK